MKDSLKSCPHPWCSKSDPQVITSDTFVIRVICSTCGFGTPNAYTSRQKAVSEWNHRPKEDKSRKEIERLRKHVAALQDEVEDLSSSGPHASTEEWSV